MGTNFYVPGGLFREERHLGKRSAAGLYCYECEVSLVTGLPGGTDVVNPHLGHREVLPEACPKCGKSRTNKQFFCPELFRPNAQEVAQEEESAVRYASSFTYDMSPDEVAALSPRLIVVSEYGDRMTVDEFRRNVLGTAKFVFTDSVGRSFS